MLINDMYSRTKQEINVCQTADSLETFVDMAEANCKSFVRSKSPLKTSFRLWFLELARTIVVWIRVGEAPLRHYKSFLFANLQSCDRQVKKNSFPSIFKTVVLVITRQCSKTCFKTGQVGLNM